MTDLTDVIAWDPELERHSNLSTRYHYWEPIAGLAQDRSYEFDIVAVFWDPLGKCYQVGRTSGCSCPSPWDEAQTEIKTARTPREAITYLTEFIDNANGYGEAYSAAKFLDAVDTIRNHKGDTTNE